ncbi:MAG: hypothetical protein V9G19_19760 [Tetrasphaera sp.]
MRQRDPWDLADPEATLAEILERSSVGMGEVVIARVDIETQSVTGTRILKPPRDSAGGARSVDVLRKERERARLSDRVRRVAEQLAPAREWDGYRWAAITGVFVTVVCREGRVVDAAADWLWLNAWRYSNHGRDAFDGDVYIMTPHGWSGILDTRCGLAPALGTTSQPQLRLLPGA